MWMLSFLPDFVFHLITICGILGIVASFFFGFIPFVYQYKLPIQVVSIVLLVFGIYFEGGITNQAMWEAKVKELEVKVAQSEAKSAKQNIKIIEKIVTKEKVIRDNRQDVMNSIDSDLIKYDNQCNIPNEFINIVNRAAEQPK